MIKKVSRNEMRKIRHTRIRENLSGTSERPRLCVFRSNANIRNMIIGVSEGYKKGLEIVGVGYKFNVQGNKLTISAGYSHPVVMEVPNGLTVTGISNTEIEVSGIDKEKVGEFAANVRKVRKPEPYKGKGIKYKGEQIRRKEGKKASK